MIAFATENLGVFVIVENDSCCPTFFLSVFGGLFGLVFVLFCLFVFVSDGTA